MPQYDVGCSQCGLQSSVAVKLADLAAWDLAAECPECKASGGIYCRVFIHAPAGHGGDKSSARSEASKKSSAKSHFVKSGQKDAMMHKQAKNFNREQAGALRDSVAKGEYEGF